MNNQDTRVGLRLQNLLNTESAFVTVESGTGGDEGKLNKCKDLNANVGVRWRFVSSPR
jgi:hypothetical protein